MRLLPLILLLSLLSRGAPPAAAQPPSSTPMVTVELKALPLRKAVETLLGGTGIQYAVAPNVPDVPITLRLRDVAADAALRVLVRLAASQAPGVTASHVGELYVIALRPAPPPASRSQRAGAPRPIRPRSPGVPTLTKIPLRHAAVAIIAPSLGGTLLPQEGSVNNGNAGGFGGTAGTGVGAAGGQGAAAFLVPAGIEAILGLPGENALLVRGTPEAIAQLREVIRLLDIAPKQIAIGVGGGGGSASSGSR
jgi:hypothetical protein